ncbi:hypothetical protein JOD45_002273 [Scopulibacillus daqui]|uniref:DUF1259 domain-containing protein n=1 Tax=Scopulibacillus daqui TaxID=1469162 RepID=A0ABS2Q171_9BACL|nr:DUF1259 domain-containing protein [Scopulibacillus daqui]MBM7646048.1 hypothetical protein [Scopulibacillus daqui]
MKRRLVIALLCLMIFPSIPPSTGQASEDSCQTLENVFKTKMNGGGGICKLNIPRKKLNVTMNGLKLPADFMSIGFMVNFKQVGDKTAVMGEFALLGDEVNPVIDQLRKGQLEITALHNHMIDENPRIFFLHFKGVGDINRMSQAVKSAILETHEKNKNRHYINLTNKSGLSE